MHTGPTTLTLQKRDGRFREHGSEQAAVLHAHNVNRDLLRMLPCPECEHHSTILFDRMVEELGVPTTIEELDLFVTTYHNRVNASINQRNGESRRTDWTPAEVRVKMRETMNRGLPYGTAWEEQAGARGTTTKFSGTPGTTVAVGGSTDNTAILYALVAFVAGVVVALFFPRGGAASKGVQRIGVPALLASAAGGAAFMKVVDL